jgi:hypothetical protein
LRIDLGGPDRQARGMAGWRLEAFKQGRASAASGPPTQS